VKPVAAGPAGAVPGRLQRLLASVKNGLDFRALLRALSVPLFALLIFLAVWDGVAAQIKTSLGQVPGPVAVAQQALRLVDEHLAERARERDFYQRQRARLAEELAQNPQADMTLIPYTGKPSFLDQIGTSMLTVAAGFLLASLIAVPLGVLCGLNPTLYSAVNPFIQLFKPVSPLAWLPIVTIVVSAVYVSQDPMFSKSFITSAITVTLCCLWPTAINTAIGVASVDKDLLNVSRVLRLGALTKVRRIVLPASVPMIFAGLRVSLGIGWMVLIAAEMLAQNPGLGKFIWDEFQNGSSDSLARIFVAVFTIGIIGVVLDRAMLLAQKRVSWDKSAVLR
jgi:nitrate/nitrite transport system permease protein